MVNDPQMIEAAIAEARQAAAPLKATLLPPHLWVGIVKTLLAAFLGIVIPLTLMAQAHTAIKDLDEHLSVSAQLSDIGKSLPASVLKFESGNDYAMYSLAMIEASNFRGLVNKQRMKVAVIHIGFAIASVGLLFIVLGFDQGGVEVIGAMESNASVNIKVAGSGLAVFVLGAGLAAAGGLLPNHYTTAGMPDYVAFIPKANTAQLATSAFKFKAITKAQAKNCIEEMADQDSMNSCLQSDMTK